MIDFEQTDESSALSEGRRVYYLRGSAPAEQAPKINAFIYQKSKLLDSFRTAYLLLPSVSTSLCTTTIMAEIHDQFDTILILDFGSQVRRRLSVPQTRTQQPAVQSLDHSPMPRAQCIRRAAPLHHEACGRQVQAQGYITRLTLDDTALNCSWRYHPVRLALFRVRQGLAACRSCHL